MRSLDHVIIDVYTIFVWTGILNMVVPQLDRAYVCGRISI